jgi:hypothetical protein
LPIGTLFKTNFPLSSEVVPQDGLLFLIIILAKGMVSLESLSVITPLTVCCADNEKGNTKNKIIEKKLSFIKI